MKEAQSKGRLHIVPCSYSARYLELTSKDMLQLITHMFSKKLKDPQETNESKVSNLHLASYS